MNPVLIVYLILFLAGMALKFFPPKKINWFYGYRTFSSMSSEAAFKYANRVSADLLMLLSPLFLIGVWLLSLFIESSNPDRLIFLSLEPVILLVILVFGITEIKIRRFRKLHNIKDA